MYVPVSFERFWLEEIFLFFSLTNFITEAPTFLYTHTPVITSLRQLVVPTFVAYGDAACRTFGSAET